MSTPDVTVVADPDPAGYTRRIITTTREDDRPQGAGGDPGVRIDWALSGPAGTVHLAMTRRAPQPPGQAGFTDQGDVWPLSHRHPDGSIYDPLDFGWHRPLAPGEPDDDEGTDECLLLPGEGRCSVRFYGPNSWQLLKAWAAARFDDEALWGELTGLYRVIFEGADGPLHLDGQAPGTGFSGSGV